MVARIRAEIDGHMGIVKRAEVKKKLKEMKEKEKKEKDKKEEGRNPKKESTLLRIRLLKKSYDVMKEAGLPSTKGHHISSEILGLEEESVSDPAQQKMIIVRMETHSQSKLLDITPQPQQPAESTLTVPPAPSKISPPLEATVALMMIANTVSYVPKQFSAPLFSLGFTDSSQEETLTQEGQPAFEKGKSPETPILIEKLEKLVEQIENTGVKAALNFAEDKSPSLKKQPAD
ncbi:hypothetical protein Ahy_B06g080607 [Arachis hypogaea]|uniref:Uncharacterized protein n=1 Tax=Arachis hypogaea TaxID=3818 RepID=A0A444YIM2_ARAHY|nr:hypothetical protein Ahy_B06g080607 [Arachis hypogaea]